MLRAPLRHLVVIGASLLTATAARAQLQVTSHTPGRHAVVAANAAIIITFDRPLQTSSITASSFRAFGRASGAVSGSFTFSNANQTVMLTPSHVFSAGETVLVNLSHDIVAADTTTLRSEGYAYAFLIAAQPASMTFQQIDEMSNKTGGSGGPQTRIYGAMASDLNGDGFVDLTTVNEVSADLRVFMNAADGTGAYDPFLTPPRPIGVESSPNEPADFDNDGNTDICAAASSSADSVSIALGNGDGTYDPVQQVAVGNDPHGIAVLDVDGDADLDIVTANFLTDNLALMINNGSGVFAAASFFNSGVGNGEWPLAAADMNNDGITDLVVGAQNAQEIVVMLGNGNGTFTGLAPQVANGLVWQLVTGDVNGDGDMDVTTANSGSATGSVLLGNGDGTLGLPATVDSPGHTVATDLGDLDGDGDLDWLLSSFGGGAWYVYVNDGSGGFGTDPDQTFIASNSPSCGVILDFDNDGDLDLALTDELEDTVRLMRNGPLVSPCPVSPSVCREPVSGGKALLKIKDFSPDTKDQILWKWLKGAATTKPEFGDPLATDDYTLCIYDNGSRVAEATAPAGGTCDGDPCWIDESTRYRYKDTLLTPQGVQKMQLRPGAAGEAKIIFRGKGGPLEIPNLALLTGPIDVQLIKSSGGICWGATYSAPFLVNGGGILKDRAD